MIKIIFFDIDGTLINYGAKDITPKVKIALLNLQKKGIKLFIATGRASFYIPDFKNITFDGALSFNGAYCFDQNNAIYKNPLCKKDVMQMIKNAYSMHKAVALTNPHAIAANFEDEELNRYFRIARQHLPISPAFPSLLEEEVYQAMVAIPVEKEKALLQNCHHLKTARWVNWAVDIIPDNGGKDKAIAQILEYYDLDQSESMAFGDGQNDADMLRYVHIGVAMNNAMEPTKRAADYITTDVKEDGIVHALKHFHLL